MPSYKNLAIIALAASSVSPALSAPTRYEERRRDVITNPEITIPSSNPYPMYPTICIHPPCVTPPPSFTIGLTHPGGSSKRAADAPESRDIAELEGRTSGLSGGEWAALAGHEMDQRDVS